MLQAVNYCKCGEPLRRIHVFLKQLENETIAEYAEICPKCLNPIEIDLRKWGIYAKDEG